LPGDNYFSIDKLLPRLNDEIAGLRRLRHAFTLGTLAPALASKLSAGPIYSIDLSKDFVAMNRPRTWSHFAMMLSAGALLMRSVSISSISVDWGTPQQKS
jgi:hypothetical protein